MKNYYPQKFTGRENYVRMSEFWLWFGKTKYSKFQMKQTKIYYRPKALPSWSDINFFCGKMIFDSKLLFIENCFTKHYFLLVLFSVMEARLRMSVKWRFFFYFQGNIWIPVSVKLRPPYSKFHGMLSFIHNNIMLRFQSEFPVPLVETWLKAKVLPEIIV